MRKNEIGGGSTESRSERKGHRRAGQWLRIGLAAVVLLAALIQSPYPASADTGIGTVNVGNTPLAMVVNPDTNKIYVANNMANTVSVINGETNSVMNMAVGLSPQAIALNPAINRIYVANGLGNSVSVIDGATDSVIATVGTGALPNAIAVNPSTNMIYVTNRNSDNMTVIDGATNTATAAVPVGIYPVGIAANPQTNKIYVVSGVRGGNVGTVTIVDGVTNGTTSLPAGKDPAAVAVNPTTNRIYVTNSLDATVTVINGDTNAASTIPVQPGPSALTVNPETNKIYVGGGGNQVTVIDGSVQPNAVQTTVATGLYPYALAVNEITNKIYTANLLSNDVTVIDGELNTGSTIAAGTSPCAVVVNPVTNRIYVANQLSNSVTVIQGSSRPQAAIPAASPPGGAVASGTEVSLSTPTSGATIHYTTDGSMPTVASAVYSTPIPVTGVMTIKAIAVKTGMTASPVMSESYTIMGQAAIPAANPPGGAVASGTEVSLSTATSGATIHYTTDGSTPTVASAVYGAPIPVTGAMMIQAIAVKTGMTASPVMSEAYTILPAPPEGGGPGPGPSSGAVRSSNADLRELKVWEDGKVIPLNPAFDAGTTVYSAWLKGDRAELTAAAAHSAAQVKLQDHVLADRTKVSLQEGDNIFDLVVQAEDGHSKTYTLHLHLEPSACKAADIAGHWAEEYIQQALSNHMVQGYPDCTFKPDHPVTRAEFTVMLAQALKLDAAVKTLPFTDKETIGDWANAAVIQAVAAGIVNGYEDGSFRPNANITRAEMVSMIVKAAGLSLDASSSAATGFADDKAIPQWSKGAIETAKKAKILSGRAGNRFEPNETATRAEAVTMLLRMPEPR
ncbi:chitobiase/beta-hexosaminidase C-terminal domain-containing protein [Cohnella nanjingensis]|nr:chitobiase/beta-hexosaminidase C-terminal domain-containing protein [Cohnella nanjingensis]